MTAPFFLDSLITIPSLEATALDLRNSLMVSEYIISNQKYVISGNRIVISDLKSTVKTQRDDIYSLWDTISADTFTIENQKRTILRQKSIIENQERTLLRQKSIIENLLTIVDTCENTLLKQDKNISAMDKIVSNLGSITSDYRRHLNLTESTSSTSLDRFPLNHALEELHSSLNHNKSSSKNSLLPEIKHASVSTKLLDTFEHELSELKVNIHDMRSDINKLSQLFNSDIKKATR